MARSVTVSGFGYWSGQDIHVEFRPAPTDTGIVFVRQDAGGKRIRALVENRIEMPRRTTLRENGTTVEMVEHVLAALYALKIDNCEVWVDAAEMPGCDGSSQAFVAAIDEAGVVTQNVPQQQLVAVETIRIGNDDAWVEIQPVDVPALSLRYRLDYGPGPIGRQTFDIRVSPATFKGELATARTFLLKHEADWLRSQGLGTRVTPKDVLVFGEDGLIDNELRFEDECVRHKTLDLVGDLALAGCDVVGRVIAYCSGHRLNAELVAALRKEGRVVSARRRTA